MPLTLTEFEALAVKAMPIPEFKDDGNRNGKDDWGSERQIEAENHFFDMVRAAISEDQFEALESYSLKATTAERVAEGLRLVRLWLKPKYKIHLQRTYERWGGTVNTTLCGRNSDVAIDTDDENVTADRAKVTCKFCLSRMKYQKNVTG